MEWVKLSCPNFSSRNRKLFNQNHIKTAVKKKKLFFFFLLLLCSFFCWWSESSSKKGFHFLFEDPYAKNIMWWIESFPIMSLYVERKLWYIQRKRRKRERSEYIEKLKALWIERKHPFSFLHSIIIAVGLHCSVRPWCSSGLAWATLCIQGPALEQLSIICPWM